MSEQPGFQVTMQAIWETLQDVRDRVTRIESSTDAMSNLSTIVSDHEQRLTRLETQVKASGDSRDDGRAWIGVAVQLGSLAVAVLGMIIVLIQTI